MKFSIRLLILNSAVILLGALVCAGCSPGGGSPLNVGSVRVLNALASDFESVEVYSTEGSIIHGASFGCPAGQACILLLPIDPDTQPLTYRFRDRRGRLVGASTTSLAAETGYSIQITADATGMDLFARLVESGRFSAATMMHLIDAHVYKEFAAGGRPSLFADLAGHYQRALADPAYSEAQYFVDVLKATGAQTPGGSNVPLDALHLPTLSAATLRSPSLVATTSVAPAGSSAGSSALPMPCPPALNGLQGVVGGYGAVALAASNPVFASVLGVTSTLVGGACTTINTNAMLNAISNKLDEIQGTLNSMNTQLGTIGIKLDLIASQIADATLQASYSGFNSDQLNVDKVIKTYQGLLRPASSGNYSLKQFDNLNAYLLSLSSGFNQSTYSSNPALRSLLGDLKSHLDTYNRLLDSPRATSIRNSISAMCQNAETIVGDIVARRNQCNALVLAALGTSAASAQRLALVMDDLINAIDAQFAAAAAARDDAKTEWLRGVLVNNLYPSLTWQQTREQLKTDMLRSLDSFFSIVTPAIVDPLDGLPTTLKTNLVNAGCDKSTGGSSVAAVEAWTITEAGPPARAPSPGRYIVVQCKGRLDELVYSRLHYTLDVGAGDSVLNVLGVLINPNLPTPQAGDPEVARFIQGEDGDLCPDKWRSDCDWFLAAPGQIQVQDGKGRIQVTPLQQTRSHTAPLPRDGRSRATTVDDYEYPQGIHVVQPVIAGDGCDCTISYTGTPIQVFWTGISGAVDDVSDLKFVGYMSFTWVTDLEGWLNKADPRFTRTVIFRAGSTQQLANKYFTRYHFWCASSDCALTDPLSAAVYVYDSLTFQSGPKLSWGRVSGVNDRLYMFVDGKSGDGHSKP